MNKKLLIATVGVGALLASGNHHPVQGQVFDTVLDGMRHSSESPRNDRSYDSGRYDDRSRRDDDRRTSRFRNESNDPDAIVRRAYEDILNREPDREGLRVYRSHIIDDNWSERDVRSDLRKSAEHEGRTPAAADVVIRRAYQDILGRDPDSAGLALYRSKLLKDNWSERDVRSDLKNSAEYRQKHGRK